jgi:hypothetical protein
MKSFMDGLDVWTEPGRGTRVKLVKVLPGGLQSDLSMDN